MSAQILVETAVSSERLKELGVSRWPVWEKEVSCFPWTYDSSETCFLIDGEVIVTPQGACP